MSVQTITEQELAANGVSSLPLTPTASPALGGRDYTPGEVKAAFDRLPRLIAARLNALLGAVTDGALLADIPVAFGEANVPLSDLLSLLAEHLQNPPVSDSAPMSESENTVTSGGVYTALVALRDEVLAAVASIVSSAITAQQLTYDAATGAVALARSHSGEAFTTAVLPIPALAETVALLRTLLGASVLSETVEDAYTSRETAGGLPVVDSAPTTVHKISGATRSSDNLFDLAGAAVTVETYGITVTADNNRLTFTGTPTRTSFGLVSDIDLGGYVGETLTFSQTPVFSAWNVSGAVFWQIYRDGAVLGHAANAGGSITVEIEEGHTYKARIQFGGSTDAVDGETIAFMANVGETALPYSDYYPGVKTASFGGIVSTGADVSDATFALVSPVTLGKWDYIDVDAQKLLTGTATLTQETPLTDEQLAQYTDYVLSADRKTVAYRTAATTETALTLPKTYKAWQGGTESVTGNPSGLAVTVTQDYYVRAGGEEA